MLQLLRCNIWEAECLRSATINSTPGPATQEPGVKPNDNSLPKGGMEEKVSPRLPVPCEAGWTKGCKRAERRGEGTEKGGEGEGRRVDRTPSSEAGLNEEPGVGKH